MTNIAIENGPFSSWIFPLKMVDLSMAMLNYQRVNIDESMSNLKMLMLTLSSSVITPGCGTHSIDLRKFFERVQFQWKIR